MNTDLKSAPLGLTVLSNLGQNGAVVLAGVHGLELKLMELLLFGDKNL